MRVLSNPEWRNLLFQMAAREIQQRYKGSALGAVWVLLVPLSMLYVYTFVFRDVLGAKWPGAESGVDFAFNLFAGLIVFNLFSEVFGRAPSIISEQPNLVKKVVFPLEVLAWVSVLNSLFFAGVSLVVLLIGLLVFKGQLTLSSLAVPLVLVAFLPALLGISWAVSALSVYLPDVKQIVAMLITPLLFLSPVFYPVSSLPEIIQGLIVFNPVTIIIEALRVSLLQGAWPDFIALSIYSSVSLAISFLGWKLFAVLRKGFADVL